MQIVPRINCLKKGLEKKTRDKPLSANPFSKSNK